MLLSSQSPVSIKNEITDSAILPRPSPVNINTSPSVQRSTISSSLPSSLKKESKSESLFLESESTSFNSNIDAPHINNISSPSSPAPSASSASLSTSSSAFYSNDHFTIYGGQ